MPEGGSLDFLRYLLLFCDGMAMVGASERAWFYRDIRFNIGMYRIYVFFVILATVYVVTTFSDLCVVAGWPIWWVRTPIVRGLVLRVPIALVLVWMMNRKLA